VKDEVLSPINSARGAQLNRQAGEQSTVEKKPNRDDIRIGEKEWITFVDIAGRPYDQAVSIDHLIFPMESFWSALELNCVASCCGIDAFSLLPKDAQAVVLSHAKEEILARLVCLREFVEKSSADTFVSSRLNNLFDKKVLLEVVHHVHRTVATDGSA
jgi:hypothetical protein